MLVPLVVGAAGGGLLTLLAAVCFGQVPHVKIGDLGLATREHDDPDKKGFAGTPGCAAHPPSVLHTRNSHTTLTHSDCPSRARNQFLPVEPALAS